MTAPARTREHGGWSLPGLRLAFCQHDQTDPDAWLPPEGAGWAPRRQRDFAAGRAAAAQALRALTGQAVAPPVGRGRDRAPKWPEGVTGSISHAGGRAVALVGRADRFAGLGVDLENPAPSADRLAPMVLSRGEIARLTDLTQQASAAALCPVTLAFSAKEALFKALYPSVGRYFGFDAAAVMALGPGGGVLRLCEPLGPWAAGMRFGFRWQATCGQVLTVVAIPAPRR